MKKASTGSEATGNALHLTKQELRVLQAMANVGSVPDIADSLGISPHTVETHIDHLRRKSGVHHPAQIVAWGYENGFLTVRDSEG